MTMEEFDHNFREGIPVHCANVQERADVIEWLAQTGYTLSPPARAASRVNAAYTRAWLEYMHPMYNTMRRVVSMTCSLTRFMSYSDVRELFDTDGEDCPICTENFSADIAALFS